MKKTRLNYLIDVGLFIQFVLVGYSGLVMYFNEHGAGYFLRLIHDKVGILMLIFFVVHIALHWKWIVTTTKNFFVRKRKIKKSSKIKLNYLVDLAFFVQFVLVGYSGLIMSFNHHAAGPILRLIHDKVGILMLAFFAVHIALHRRWILFTTKKFFLVEIEGKESKVTRTSK